MSNDGGRKEKKEKQYDERSFHSTGKYAAQKRKKRKETEKLFL